MSRAGRRGLMNTRRLTTILVTAALMFVGIPGTISIVRGTPLASCTGVGALANGSFESISGTPTWNEYTSDQSNDNLFGDEPRIVSFVGENLSSPGMNSWLTTASDNQIEVWRIRTAGTYLATVVATNSNSASLQVTNSDNAPFTDQDIDVGGTRYNVSSGRSGLGVIADPYTFVIDDAENDFSVGQSITYAIVYSVSSTITSLFGTDNVYQSVFAAEGDNYAELNANQASTLFQDVDTVPGTTLFWSISHQGRSTTGSDTMKVKIGTSANQVEQSTITRTLSGTTTSVSTISTARGATGVEWATYRGSYSVPSGQTVTRFAFESVSAAISATSGNFLDNISFLPLAACPLTRSAVAGTTVTINPFDTGVATFAYAPTGTTITSASVTSGSGSVSITNSNTRLSFTPPSSAGSTVINYVLSYSQDGVASTSEGEITVTTSIQAPTIAWSSPTYGNDILDASCTTGAATQTTDGATRRIVFTAPSQTSGSTGCTFTPPVGVTSIEVLVVGGGGGGGGRFVGGGGGAGGLRTNSNFAVTPGTSYSITVGAGGAGGANSPGSAANAMGTSGSSSIFGSITSAGGGGGGGYLSNPGQAGRTGGSGGGGSGSANATNAGGTATPAGQGNNGGSGTVASGQNPGGGGGGASGVGGNGGSSGGGAGGAGTSNNITGSFVTYAAGGGGGADSAAGGGAGGSSNVGGRGGNVNVAGAAATANTGSGGGGAGGGSGQTGGRGAAGIVIIKYDLGTSTTVPAPGTATGTWSVSSSGGGVQSTGTVILQSAPYANTSCGTFSDVGTATSGAAQSTAVNTCYRWTFDTTLSAAAVPPTELAGNSSTENLTSIIVVALSPTVTGPADQTATNNVSAQVIGAYTANGFSGSSSISTSISISGVTGVTFSLPTTTGLTRTAGSSWTGISSVTFTSTRANAVAALSAMTIATNANNGTAEISVTMTEGSASASDSVLVNIGWVGRWPDTMYADPQRGSVLITAPFTSFPSVTNLALCVALDAGVADGVIDISRTGGNAVGGSPDTGSGTLVISGDQSRLVSASGPYASVFDLLSGIRVTWTAGGIALGSNRTVTINIIENPTIGVAYNCSAAYTSVVSTTVSVRLLAPTWKSVRSVTLQ